MSITHYSLLDEIHLSLEFSLPYDSYEPQPIGTKSSPGG